MIGWPPTALWRLQAQRAYDGASCNKIDYIALVYGILNLKRYANLIIGLKVPATLHSACKASLFVNK